MSHSWQLPRNSLIWLLAAMFAGIAPHLLRLPLWVTLVCLLCGGWRVMVYRSRWHLPGRWLKALLVFSGVTAVIGHYGTLFGPDAGTALLILGFCFKLLETQSRRDAFTVIVLGFFVVATAFFYTQSMASAAYLLLVCFMVTAALVGLNQSPLQTNPKRTARRSLVMIAQTVPLMLILFIFVPRVAPLWSLDLSGSRAKTGLSDQISPGDIAQLSRSPELAFRAEFDGAAPPVAKLYWRALVMDHYDGRSWTRGDVSMDVQPSPAGKGPEQPAWRNSLRPLGEFYSYRIIMEPTDQRWLFALAAADSDASRVLMTRDFRLLSAARISQPFSYRVKSALNYRADVRLPQWLARRNLLLPAGGDSRTRRLAREWAQQAGSAEAYVDRVLDGFRSQPFRYTLRPPPLQGDRIDQFMFETRQGFCSHYAGAFVFMMRAAGIPARVVAGYQGGELNPLGNYLLVHQFDAHAWAEVWLPGQGWTRVDPTAAIAPERVEQGVEQALAGEQSFLEDSLLSPSRYRSIGWVSQLRLALDYVNFAWHRSVLGYDARFQTRFLSGLFGKADFRTLGIWLVVLIAVVLLVLSALLFRRRRLKVADPVLRLYLKFCDRMAARGHPRLPGEPPGAYLQRLKPLMPEKGDDLEELAGIFISEQYAGERLSESGWQRMKRLVRRL